VLSVLLFGLISCNSDDDSAEEEGEDLIEDLDVDEMGMTFFEDLDNDGVGNENVSMIAVETPMGYVLEPGDFDDTNEEVQTIEDASLMLLTTLGESDVSAWQAYVNSESFIQHNQTFFDGVGFVLAGILYGDFVGTTYELSRVFTDVNEEGDTIVVLHGIYGGTWNGGNPEVAFNIFRFDTESGLVEEHWDNLMPITDPVIDVVNGNTQVDGMDLIEDEDVTEANKIVVANFINDVLIGGMWATLGPTYFNESREYIQHSPGVENGIEYFDDLGDNFQVYDSLSPRFLYGEGNFVLALSQGNDDSEFANVAFYDLFRLEDGVIIEHWDVVQDILTDEEAINDNGKW